MTTMIMLALIATVIALGMGIYSMLQGGEFDRQHSVQFMTARVGLQGAALLFLVLALTVG